MFSGWRVIDRGSLGLLIVKGCGAAATKIELDALIRCAQKQEDTKARLLQRMTDAL